MLNNRTQPFSLLKPSTFSISGDEQHHKLKVSDALACCFNSGCIAIDKERNIQAKQGAKQPNACACKDEFSKQIPHLVWHI
eukprot:5219593-Amphidinium_carterae.1